MLCLLYSGYTPQDTLCPQCSLVCACRSLPSRGSSATVLSVPLQVADPVAAACEALLPLMGSEQQAHTSEHCGHSVSWGVYPER